MSTKAERTESITSLEKEFKEARGIYLADNNKMNVAQATRLRADIRKAGMRFVVVKNSLAKIAAKRAGREALQEHFKGPTAVVFAREDAAVPAKIVKDFQKENKGLLGVKIAYVDGSIFDAAAVLTLADIPSREVLLAQLLGCFNAPMGKFAGTLSGILVKFARTLDALRKKRGVAA
ncbi:MAG: 50S ribosomal protein L10 [Chitinispirillaceae bacterium]|nr:50S ribosomal protein L10 [Chitinispirillaceae bacterium]